MTSAALAVLQRNDSMEMARQYAVWAKQHPGGGAMPLDFSNEVHYRVIRNRLLASGKTADNSPELFTRLDLARTRAAVRTPVSQVDAPLPWCAQEVPFGEAPRRSGNFTAKSVFTCRNGSDYSYASVATYATTTDLSNFDLLETTSTEDFEQTLISTDEVAGDVTPAPGRILFFDSVTMAFNDTDDYSGYLPADASNFVPDRDQELHIDHPVEIQGNPADNPIRICLYREYLAGGQQDCDYGSVRKNADGSYDPFVTTGATGIAAAIPNPANTKWVPDPTAYFAAPAGIMHPFPQLIPYVPLKGYYDSGAVNRQECLNPSTTASAQLFLLDTGGSCPGVALNGPVTGQQDLPWTSKDPNSSRWNFSGLLDFGQSCLTNLQNVYMMVKVTNEACGGGRGKTVQLPTIDFRNSCLAEGTMVALASGKSLPVEKLAVGDKVVAGSKGRALTVQAISHGAEPYPIVRLKDDKGHDVMVTGTHPMVMANGGVVAAEKIIVGDRVMTNRGPSRVTTVDRIKYTKQVYNFVLGTPQELAAVGRNERTLFANGFLVGDSVMQRELEDRMKPTREEMVARLPEAWRRDYEYSRKHKKVAAR